ncbi:MAG: hypothetical protein R6V10_07695 [bacterium]
MKHPNNGTAETSSGWNHETRREVDRFNARMRHFQGVAASVMREAQELWEEIWEVLQDPRTPEEIIDDVPLSKDALPSCGWPEFMEKLHLLGHYLDYTRRLCDGSVCDESEDEMEVS